MPSTRATMAVAGGVGEVQTVESFADQGPAKTRIASAEVETRIASAVGRASVEQAAHSQQQWQPLGDGRWGRVVGREGAER